MPRKPEYDRNELIDRARDLFWKQGWAGTSMKDLETVLELKPGSFYAAFGSKDALFELALERYAEDGGRRLDILIDELGPMGALQALPFAMIADDEAPAKACMLAKSVLELSGRDHALAEVADRHLNAMEARFTRAFRDAQAAGRINQTLDPSTLARRYQSDLMGLRISAEREGVDARAIAEEISASLTHLTPQTPEDPAQGRADET
ncbi:MAG: TetR/AcrR family transcriptional regulator [Pseudomonadota bacterium]